MNIMKRSGNSTTDTRPSSSRRIILKKTLKWSCITIGIIAILLVSYIYIGFSNKNVRIDYKVIVKNPEDGMIHVKMNITEKNRPFMHLFLSNAYSQGHERIRNIKVKSGGSSAPFWHTIPFEQKSSQYDGLYTIWTGLGSKAVEIDYTIESKSIEKATQDARFYIDRFGGYLCGKKFLFSPVTSIKDVLTLINDEFPTFKSLNKNAGIGSISFSLPKGWRVNSSWGDGKAKDGIAKFRYTYFYIGDMIIKRNKTAPIPFSLAVNKAMGKEKLLEFYNNALLDLKTAEKFTGVKIKPKTPYYAINLSEFYASGGISSPCSFISVPDNMVMAHELFHNWNGSTIKSGKDMNWFTEGTTQYYQYKIAYKVLNIKKSGMSFDEYIKNQLDLVSGYITQKTHKINFLQASKRFADGKMGMDDAENIYAGGAYIAYYLDSALKAKHKSLDSIWVKFKKLDKIVSEEDFLNVIEEIGGRKLANNCRNVLEGKASISKYMTK